MSKPKVDTIHFHNPDDSRPHLVVDIYGERYHGLLDSGASISILGSEASVIFVNAGVSLHDCGSDEFSKVAMANGSIAVVRGYCFLPVTFQNVTKEIKFYVVPEVQTPLIFGVNFWREFRLAPNIFPDLPAESKPAVRRVSELRSLHHFEELSDTQRAEARAVMRKFEEVSSEKIGLGRTSLLTHTIDTGTTAPIKQRYFCLSPERLKELNRQLDEMLELGVVEPSSSEWNNPVLMVPKSNGEMRFCLDSRKLNAVSKGDAYPLPYISHILNHLGKAKYLSSIDLKAAFWQIGLDSVSSREKTAFTVPGRGLFQFVVMSFGLKGAPATQQRLMDKLFGPEFDNRVFVYLDDIIVVSSSFSEHLSLLEKVLERLNAANLSINLSKSQFFRKELKYLGFVVDERGLHTDPAKVQAIVDYPTPTNKKEVKMFLGTASYYRRFIKDFSSKAAPLNALTSTRKNAPPFHWSEAAEQAFANLKSALVSAPVLACPDFSLPFAVQCDASGYGIAATLTQVLEDGEEHPIAYSSRSLNSAERNYSATEREALAVVFGVERFRPYLEGGPPFKVITDHSSLKWFFNLTNPTGRLARWGCRLSPYQFDIVHRKGKDNIVPDALSRVVPVSEIVSAVDDPWYNRLLHRCTQSPRSFPNFLVSQDKLFRYSKNKFGHEGEFEWKEVVPLGARASLIRNCHEGELAPHFGIFKTYKRLALRYFWPKMYEDVEKFVNGCDVCSAYKHSQDRTPGLLGSPKVCSRPFEMLSVDLCGPFPRSRAGYTSLLVVVCCFTKYCVLFPLRRAIGKNIVKCLEESVFLAHGVPRTVVMDNGTQFTGKEVRALFDKYKIPSVHFTPRYTPQVNTVERYNRTVVTAISILVGKDHRTWDVSLSKIQFAMNTAVNETTRFTPFFLVHGREAVTCGSMFIKDSSPLTLACSPRADYVRKLGCLEDVFFQVSEALSKAHQRSAAHYNKSRRKETFVVGDVVWKRTYPLSDASKFFMAKLAPKYDKCRVSVKISDLVYELEDAVTGKPLGQWHVKDLKRDQSP